MSTDQQTSPRTLNAVMVVPGIMGSELVDNDGRVAWGLSPSLLATAWSTRQLDVLHPSEEELEGRPRLRPTRLLRIPAFMPFLGGLEPYSAMIERAGQVTSDPRAVAEFAYDWRLSIAYNAALLVKAGEEHLTRWRELVASERMGDPAAVRLVIVAHSMGGLVARYASAVLELEDILGELITAGTPYFGSLNALEMIATGKGGPPLPRRAARELAVRCPAVYDLLPRYRCVTATPGEPRVLSVADITAVGGRPDLAQDAGERWEKLGLRQQDTSESVWSKVKAVIGTDQPTWQSVAFNGGTCAFSSELSGVNYSGDSTVYSGAASPIGVTCQALPQKHGSLLQDSSAVTLIHNWILGKVTGPPLGTRPIGADIPDLVKAGSRPIVTVTGTAGNPVGVSVTSTDLTTSRPTTWPSGKKTDAMARFEGPALAPGLHRIEVKAGGFSPVTDTILVFPDEL